MSLRQKRFRQKLFRSHVLVLGCARTLSVSFFVCWAGCMGEAPPEDGGGLTAEDFELISLNGLDPEDNAVDKNDYAWSAEYFQADGEAQGYVYVGTGNDMIGLIYQGIAAVMGVGELGDIAARPPEIRRYRGDIFRIAWERVLDYRDIETDPDFNTIGFREMKAYRALADGTNYLYAATFGREASVWRTATGDPGTWEIVWTSGSIGSVRMFAEHKGLLYLALANDAPVGERIGKIWATDGVQFWPVLENGFGNPDNTGIMSLISYNGWLYAGTENKTEGYEIWKLEGPDGSGGPIQIVAGGGPSRVNESAITPCVFQNKLYVGNMINPASNVINNCKAADLIRIDENDQWETIAGPNSISGLDSGFNHCPNTYVWSMIVHQGWLYAGTYDQISAWFNVLEHGTDNIKAFLGQPARQRVANPIEAITGAGADLYKTQDGVNWHTVTLTGFGDVGNYGFRVMVSVGDDLYIGTGNPFDGLEVWRGAAAHDN